jgi:acyl-[acyl carrier protein]--UDP-N-acetylglucosamine O-acyltransferase
VTRIGYGASLGANSTIRCGITIHPWAMVGAGSVVTKDVPEHALVFGNPARLHGFVCFCGMRLEEKSRTVVDVMAQCPECGQAVTIPLMEWESII